MLLLNDGTGRFAFAAFPDLDLVLGRFNGGRDGSVVLLFNRGNSTFVDATIGRLGATAATLSLGLADLDQDGDLDLVLGNGGTLGGQQNQLFLNDGTGAS